MKAKPILYTAIILLPFFSLSKSKAQARERHRSVTINQTVVDGKVVASDTIITYTDTTTRTIGSKEVGMDMPYTKGSTVYIDNSYRRLHIKQSKDGKVRLATTAYFYGQPGFTNEQWLEKLNIQMKNSDTGLVIASGGINRSSSTTTSLWSSSTTTDWNKMIAERNEAVLERQRATVERGKASIERNKALLEKHKTTVERNSATPEPPVAPAPPTAAITANGTFGEGIVSGQAYTFQPGFATYTPGWGSSAGSSTAVFDEKGNNVYNSSSLRRELTIYIPVEAKLNVVSKYADVTADHDLRNLHIKISNGSLDMVNADKAVIISTYSNVSTGNIDNGDISVTSGKLSMKNANQLQLTTKYAKVEADKCNVLSVTSVSDDYDIDEVKSLYGTKTYGKLRLDKLTGSLDLKGSSADVRIRNIEPSVSTIALDNKYADIQFPVSSLKNYEVIFSGNYSSVFAPFERRDTSMEKTTSESNTVAYTTTNGTVISKTKPGTAPADQNGTVQRNDGARTVYTTTNGAVMSVLRPATAPRGRTSNFIATVGDIKGAHTKFNLTCTSCNVDFK